ncbi:hypothetical protein NC651_020385 [Populus alba x Populus x berolinensis]|nr:hypothetical protein NC651_020385 [Populus alba x Populus x berolinensis]
MSSSTWNHPGTKIQLTNTNIPSADCRSQHNHSTATAGAVHQKPPNSLNCQFFYINYSSPDLL